ncbi:MAG: PLP-dependent aminotransferase family protein, partial [Bryobacteraceae bacterium]|nr:PLP-dependent aminotransferase family protein [Bryobacteraceae bacterium]
MLGQIQLDETSPTPLYRQLRDQIASLIRSGNLANSSRLPATRELASQFGLNRTTVSAAYELLEADGLIRGHVGRGSFVHFDGPISMPTSEDAGISFESSRPSGDQFPLGDFQKTCTEVVTSTEAGSILQLGSPAGYFPLRRLLIKEAAEEGSLDDGDDLIITNGCQHALDLIQRHFTAPGSVVLVEDPVYHGLRNVFDRSAVRLVGLPVTSEGVRPEDVERAIIAERPQLVVLTPNFQNPTGLTIPLSSREAIARIIERYGITLVEND